MKHSRENILEGGIELFRNNGYHGTGIQHILKSLNIPKGSFYNYFKSKEEFVLEAIKLYALYGLENHKKLLSNTSLLSDSSFISNPLPFDSIVFSRRSLSLESTR